VEQDKHDDQHEQQDNDGLPDPFENVTSQSITPTVGVASEPDDQVPGKNPA
jgi:hypothetical protein